MPKKLHRNEKAVEAQAREKEAKIIAKSKSLEEQENSKWADEGTTAKERRQKEKAEKQVEKEEAAKKKRELLAAEEAEISMIKISASAKKETREMRKTTQFELTRTKEVEQAKKQEEVEKKDSNFLSTKDHFSTGNINQELRDQRESDLAQFGAGNVAEGSTTVAAAQKALDSLKIGPSAAKVRREKNAFKKFKEERLPELLAYHTQLRRSQVEELVFKEWKTSPQNPMNQAGEN